MQSLADGLPPEIARQVHPDWYRNERSYWSLRERLLDQYKGQWVAFADDAVIASGGRPVDVFAAAHESGRHPFVICVGYEDEPSFRMRRAAFAYDASYRGEALPVLDVEFRSERGISGLILDHVIADTGADASALPWDDCRRLQLDPAIGAPSVIEGVGGVAMRTVSSLCGSRSTTGKLIVDSTSTLTVTSGFSGATC